MIGRELPGGPASPLVRGLAACLSSATEVSPAELPDVADLPVRHALGSWRSWLAGRGSGLIPVAEPRSFAWAGWWIAVVDRSDSPLADGPDRQVAVLAFGTPAGIVLSPQDPSLLGRATADLDVTSGWAVASLDPVLPPTPPAGPLTGTVEGLAVASASGGPVRLVSQVRAVAGRGLDGDRYADGAGTFSPRGVHRPGYELTLIAAEAVEDLTRSDAALGFASTRRNVLTRGLDVNALVRREFTIGEVRCRGVRPAEPCAHLERLHGPGLLRPLIHRGGLRADIVAGGEIHQGDAIAARPA